MHSNNPRITNFISTTKEENNAIKIIHQVKQMQSPSTHFILCKYIECPILKDQPQLIQTLFEHHIHIITQMIEWMLTPKLMAKKKKMKSNLDFFPFRCKQFMKDNVTFYQQLYLSARNNKLPINIWFNFLRKQYYDKETILTALGYFGQVMIPFAKYQFAAITNLTLSMELNISSDEPETLSIMKILPKELINQLVGYCYYQPIFQFLKISILVSIQDLRDYDISKKSLLKILESSKIQNIFQKFAKTSGQNCEEVQHHVDLLENISLCLKQLITNVETGNNMQLRIQNLISIILQSGLISYVIKQILNSGYCTSPPAKQQTITKQSLSSSQQYVSQPQTKNVLLTQSSNVPCSSSSRFTTTSPKSILTPLMQYQQEDLMQIFLKILNYCVQIYIKIPKTTPIIKKSVEDSALLEMRDVNYKLLINTFRDKMQFLLHSLEDMTKIVYEQGEIISNVKSIPFSSGQKIKPITFMKFQYLKLLQNCLLMIQVKQALPTQSPDKINEPKPLRKQSSVSVLPFDVNFQKLHFIPIIEKYLSQNRWNNIVHHVLEKICHLLIICSYEYFRKNIQKDKNKKLTQSFLAFLIQNFTQRDYIFLNTFKFTNQGNLQSIYNISKDLAFTLNSTNQLVILLNQFQPWKKFLMNDLKIYEEKAYPKCTRPDEEDMQEQANQHNLEQLRVDEVDSIKKLIENISMAKKWPTKISRHKGNSKSGVFDFRKSDQPQQQTPQKNTMSKSHGFHLQNNKQKKQLVKTLDDFAKKKVDESIQYESDQEIKQMLLSQVQIKDGERMMKSQVRTNQKQLYGVFKNYSSGRTERKCSDGN